mgnify:CR=1 FL=1
MKKILLLTLLMIAFHVSSTAQQNSIKLIEVSGNTTSDIRQISEAVEPYIYKSAIDLSRLGVQNKKQAFINLMLPSILIAKHEIEQERIAVLELVNKTEALSGSEENYLNDLKKAYKCSTNTDLLSRLRTHPTSIVIAQAAIESGWGTSRFYREANNIFGVWSYSKNEARIKASENRDGKSVYVKKYDSLPKSIASYFKTIARGPYSGFRTNREKTSDVFVLISHLKVYSELREEYVRRLEELIRYNKLEQYDRYVLKMSN